MSPSPQRSNKVVVIGSSAGGVAALTALLEVLPPEFPAAILLVQHLSPLHPSQLTEILSRRTELPVLPAVEGMELQPGTVYVAPPDRHLLIVPDRRISLTSTPTVHYTRPAIDVLFQSAASQFGAATIAVVLSGTGKDGATGVTAVKHEGGTVIAQDEATSEFFGMPRSAIETGMVDYVLPLRAIPSLLVELVMGEER
jgi:two-component system chemotaxis response regulator CheB